MQASKLDTECQLLAEVINTHLDLSALKLGSAAAAQQRHPPAAARPGGSHGEADALAAGTLPAVICSSSGSSRSSSTAVSPEAAAVAEAAGPSHCSAASIGAAAAPPVNLPEVQPPAAGLRCSAAAETPISFFKVHSGLLDQQLPHPAAAAAHSIPGQPALAAAAAMAAAAAAIRGGGSVASPTEEGSGSCGGTHSQSAAGTRGAACMTTVLPAASSTSLQLHCPPASAAGGAPAGAHASSFMGAAEHGHCWHASPASSPPSPEAAAPETSAHPSAHPSVVITTGYGQRWHQGGARPLPLLGAYGDDDGPPWSGAEQLCAAQRAGNSGRSQQQQQGACSYLYSTPEGNDLPSQTSSHCGGASNSRRRGERVQPLCLDDLLGQQQQIGGGVRCVLPLSLDEVLGGSSSPSTLG